MSEGRPNYEGVVAVGPVTRVPAHQAVNVPPTWATGHGVSVAFAEIVEGRIVLTLEDGAKVMAHIVDIWRP